MILDLEGSMVNRHSLFSLELPGSSIRTSVNRQTLEQQRGRDKETGAMKKTKSK